MPELNRPTLAARPNYSATAILAYLSGLWAEVLRVPQVNPDDDFFLIGGDSALVIEMLMSVSAHFDREFQYNKFFPKPNIRTLSNLIVEELSKS
jgi:acyl carrier protein